LFVKEPKRRKNHCIFLLTGAALSDMTLDHDSWSNYRDPNGFVLGEYRDPGQYLGTSAVNRKLATQHYYGANYNDRRARWKIQENCEGKAQKVYAYSEY